jgi:hypothetical protein
VPSVIPTDGRLISALADLPLACEDLYLDGVAYGSSGGSSSSRDDQSMRELFLLLGYQNILLVWTALMLEEVGLSLPLPLPSPLTTGLQCVLVVGNPGSEQQLAHVTTAMLRLLRPLGWQHLYIPLMHASMSPVLAAVLRNHEPFFISTYREVSLPSPLPSRTPLPPLPSSRSSKISSPTMPPRSPSLNSSPAPSCTRPFPPPGAA